jgi:hypothetical protein
MSIKSVLKSITLSPPFVKLYASYLSRRLPQSQGDEADILMHLAQQFNVPHSFVEFGFHPCEYNCLNLSTIGFDGLLIDGDDSTVRLARCLLPKNVRVECKFLTIDNLDLIEEFRPDLGVLSIDVDGVDYWLTKALLPLRPAIVCVEYNASFGLRPITVPYKQTFDRHEEHSSGWYHGASLTAFTSLMKRDYTLHAVSRLGGNAIFVRRELGASESTPRELFRENSLRNSWAKNTASDQWNRICDLPYLQV